MMDLEKGLIAPRVHIDKNVLRARVYREIQWFQVVEYELVPELGGFEVARKCHTRPNEVCRSHGC